MYFPMILHSNYALELKVQKNALKLSKAINRYNVDNDYNYREELVKSFISESNGGISVFIACTEPKI